MAESSNNNQARSHSQHRQNPSDEEHIRVKSNSSSSNHNMALRQHPISDVKDASTSTIRTGDDHPSRSSAYLNEISLPCDNRPHSFYPEWTGQECDHESFFCFSEGINNHCCKCRSECCGQCNVTASNSDPFHACPSMSIDERLNDMKDFEQRTQAIVLGVIVVVLASIACVVYCIVKNKGKQMEMDPDYNKKKNLQEFRDDEFGMEGQFENDGVSNGKSS